jgi:hypothetical protein
MGWLLTLNCGERRKGRRGGEEEQLGYALQDHCEVHQREQSAADRPQRVPVEGEEEAPLTVLLLIVAMLNSNWRTL